MTAGALELPAKVPPDRLADLCREEAAEVGLQPAMVEKDYYLTRLIWALAQSVGQQALLKGGTLLSKVDLSFERMSEDVDLVIAGLPEANKRLNALRLNSIRVALVRVSEAVGLRVPFPHGERSERDSHGQWELLYDSEFGPQRIVVEATIRPVICAPRRVALKQLLRGSEVGGPYCWALAEVEARAEKVRAAFTRRAIRDYYDLQLLAGAGRDLCSPEFIELVDRKLGELGAVPLAHQPARFGMTDAERAKLVRDARDELVSVLRVDAQPFDLDSMLERYDSLWGKTR